MRPLQGNQSHVVIHPDARYAVGSVHQGRPKGRVFGRGEVGAHGLKVGTELRAEEFKGGADFFPFAEGGVGRRVVVHVVGGFGVGGLVAGRGEALGWDEFAALGGHEAGKERGRLTAPVSGGGRGAASGWAAGMAGRRTALAAGRHLACPWWWWSSVAGQALLPWWWWSLSSWWSLLSWRSLRLASSSAARRTTTGSPRFSLAGQVSGGEVGYAAQEEHDVVEGAVTKGMISIYIVR